MSKSFIRQIMKSVNQSFEEVPRYKNGFHTTRKHKKSMTNDLIFKENQCFNFQSLVTSPLPNDNMQKQFLSRYRPPLSELENSKSFSGRSTVHLMHIDSVHRIISTIRDRKSDIEDLLRAEQSKVEKEQFDQAQLSISMKKLKKVLRLFQITCKIIHIKHEEHFDMNILKSQQMSMCETFERNATHYEKQIDYKNKEIQRLQKKIDILDIPEKSYSIMENSISGLELRQGFSLCLQKFTQNQGIQTQQKVPESVSYYYPDSRIQQVTEQLLESHEKQRKTFEIANTFSYWNITKFQQKKEKQLKINKTIDIHFESEGSPFFKRYKSIYKIAINSLNLVTNIMLNNRLEKEKTLKISKKIKNTAQYFNIKYHENRNPSSETFQALKNKIEELFQEIEKLSSILF